MPEYLTPGSYVEEASFRSRSIAGVPTSTSGFAGLTRYGPVHYPDGPGEAQPRLVTSYLEFERVYGGLAPLALASGTRTAYLAHAARAYFDNGGQRLYVSRVYVPAAGKSVRECTASLLVSTATGSARWWARWPGRDGNVVIDVQAVRSENLAFEHAHDPNDLQARDRWGLQAKRVSAGAVLEVVPSGEIPASDNAPLLAGRLRVVEHDQDGRQRFVDSSGASEVLPAGSQLSLVELQMTVSGPDGRVDVYRQLATHPAQRRFIGKLLGLDNPEDEHAAVHLDWTPGDHRFAAAALAIGLQSAEKCLGGGVDGELPSPDAFGGAAVDPAVAGQSASGLAALGAFDDIAIVALPDGGTMPTPDEVQAVAGQLIHHAEQHRYRIALVDAARNSSLSDVRSFRGQFDSQYAALYHPWVEVPDPLAAPAPGESPRTLLLPPSGFIAGIYARSDSERGVHKAPANEIVRGLTRFEFDIGKSQQDVLNAEGINCLRHFEGRGYRVWGARTMSADPEWKYVSLRRLCIYIEHSIDKATQWVVFEPNSERLWVSIRSSIENFLQGLWRDGALIGAKPEEAYFVRCDRSTMSQNDLDNGRMICLIGIAPSRPAEYLMLRIGQWTADAKV